MVASTIQEVIVVGGGVWEYQDGGPPQFDGYVCVWSIAIAKLVLAQKEPQRCRSLILMPKLIESHTLDFINCQDSSLCTLNWENFFNFCLSVCVCVCVNKLTSSKLCHCKVRQPRHEHWHTRCDTRRFGDDSLPFLRQQFIQMIWINCDDKRS